MIKYILALGLALAGCATAAQAKTGALPSADTTARQLGAILATVHIWGPLVICRMPTTKWLFTQSSATPK
ncbi:hypothetical protein CU102_08405 [Phyllobacterium brassicacearum]|uniref:Uncharacterized protein n=1 Tax=Phyllobacterium brassicacearum TaxID=314235 RepID=A0A2P7BSF3_9HYPH|nr:hypothetical protein CU102_08405 [Phyllobacterium brassicacearum]TDQ34432.1 hypothetical protein DEV91_103164 [Phyllobacterium brassicacearum]